MTRLKDDPNSLLEKAEELGYTAFGPLMVTFSAWLAAEAKKQGIRRLYFLAREGHFLLEVFNQCLAAGLIADKEFDCRYFLISRRAVFGAAKKSRESLKPMLAVGPYEGSLHGLLQARLGIDSSESARLGIPDRNVFLPDDTEPVLSILEGFLAQLNEVAQPEREALLRYCKQEGLCDGQPIGLVDVGYSGSIQRWLADIVDIPLTGFYFATTILTREFRNERNRIVTCFESNCSVTVTPPVYRYALALEAWLTAPAGQLTRFIIDNGVAKPVFGEPGLMQNNFAFPSAVARGVERYITDCAFLAKFDPDWYRNLYSSCQDILAASMEAKVFEDVLHAFSVEDAFCGHGEISIYEKMSELTSGLRLSEVVGYGDEVS